jgi:hypothetical protein
VLGFEFSASSAWTLPDPFKWVRMHRKVSGRLAIAIAEEVI